MAADGTPRMKIPLRDLKAEYQTVKGEVQEAVGKVLEGMTLYMGPNIRALEAEFAAYAGARHAVGASSGTDAILLALMALGVKAGDEVIVPSHTFIASVAPIVLLGGTPVFVDIDPGTYNLDPGLLPGLLTKRTKGILAVHLYGQPAEMDPILDFARRRGLWGVEDACQAVGAEYRGRRVGRLGDMGCFSFVYTKNLTGYGDAGIVTTDDSRLAGLLQMLCDHGRADKYRHEVFGLNARLGEIEAAILRVQMKHQEARTEARRRNARYLGELLRTAGFVAPVEMSHVRHVYHQYVIRSSRRDALAAHLGRLGVQTGIHYPIPCHLQTPCAPFTSGKGHLPHTERAAGEILSLPVYPELTQEQLEYMGEAVASFPRGGAG